MVWEQITISVREMLVADENSEWLGVSRFLLMENAGAAVARAVYEWLGGVEGRKVIIFCGTGNNGGDGMAAARHLAGMGARVTVVLVGAVEKVRTREARANLEAIREMRETVNFLIARSVEELDRVKEKVMEAEAIIDAILGTGIRGKIREPWRTVIQLINSAKGFKLSVDVPSGIDPDTGAVGDVAVKADMTVTFHRAKRGMPAAAEYCGEVVVAPIGIPPEAELVMGPGDLRDALLDVGAQQKLIALKNVSREISETLRMFSASYNLVSIPEAIPEEAVTYMEDEEAVISTEGTVIKVLESEAAEKAESKRADESCRVLGELAKERGQIIYLLSSTDILTDGSRCKAGWRNRPLGRVGVEVLKASIMALLSKGVKPFKACAAAGYLAGFVEERGLGALGEELKRLGLKL